MPVGKPAPPRPRRPDCTSSSIDRRGAERERALEALPGRHGPGSRRAIAGSTMPQRAKVSRVWRLSHGMSSTSPSAKGMGLAVDDRVEDAVGVGRRRRAEADAAVRPSRPRPAAPASRGRASRCGRSRPPRRAAPRRAVTATATSSAPTATAPGIARDEQTEASSPGLGEQRVEARRVEAADDPAVEHRRRRRARRDRGNRPPPA